eukprot:gb/GEZJ01004337.1/.p1 GENE.gb/GEZJ01004337.1/~~gb/GEZJ01004337.1/.p1  ORF type:complete len:102 (-),score=0.92 gb/GEZJ01004337.1/:1664-1969(-)
MPSSSSTRHTLPYRTSSDHACRGSRSSHPSLPNNRLQMHPPAADQDSQPPTAPFRNHPLSLALDFLHLAFITNRTGPNRAHLVPATNSARYRSRSCQERFT